MEHLRPNAPGALATFYSYKGGVGRSMALANCGMLLARRDSPVLMVDWDLDAPTLHYYFPGGGERRGVLELFEACREQLRCRHGAAQDPGLADSVLDAVGWEQYVERVDDARPLYLMRAGRADADYAERVSGLNWQAMFEACPSLFRTLAARMAARFSHVLVDARSGRADSAGICTTLLPTRLVLVFTPGRPQFDGLESLVARATTYRRSHEEEQRPLLVYPLPSRIEADDAERRALWRHGDLARRIPGYQPLFERVLAEAYGYSRLSLDEYFDAVQLPQSRAHGCGEPLPALTRHYEAFLSWFGDGRCPWEAQQLQLTARETNHHRLLAEQGRTAYWRPPPGAPKANLAESG